MNWRQNKIFFFKNSAESNRDIDLSQIQPTITKLEERKQEQARQAYQLHKSLQPVPGSAEDENKAIQEANEIRLRAINAIPKFVGPM